MRAIEFVYNIFGSLICHQLPSRTFLLDGLKLPMCARDSGIYIGIFITAAFLFMNKRYNSDRPPKLSYSLILCMFMIPMLFDGVSSFLGLRDSNNTLRFVTGIYFGSSLLFFIIPAANFKLETVNENAVLRNWADIFAISFINAVVCLVLLKTDILPWIVVSTCIIFSFVFLIVRVLYMILVRCKFINTKHISYILMGTTIVVLIVMFLVSKNFHQLYKLLL